MRRAIVLGLSLAACGGGTTPPATRPTGTRVDVIRVDEAATLVGSDPFRALVEAARARADDAGRSTGEPCILARDEDGSVALRSDLALSIRPLPDPALSVEAALAAAPTHAGLLSLFGFDGRGPLLVATFTPMPPPSPRGAVVVVLTASGAHVRGTGDVAPATNRVATTELADAVEPMVAAGASPIVVAPAADVRLDDLASALTALARLAAPVALGSLLEPGTEPPRALASSNGEDPVRCAPVEPGAPPPAAALRAALAPLGERAMACRRGAASADAARGGLIRLRIRAADDGHVEHACASSEELDDPTLLRCLEAGAMGLALPASAGPYGAELPIRIARDRSFDRAPLCPPRPRY